MSSIAQIDELLNDKLFQVIGSTPASIAESLRKVDLKMKGREGAQIFAISVFAAAVNKSTLETFLADSRFATIRPLLSAALSIQGRSNMTALTLLGHCLLTTDAASRVTFTSEFRKKMGQDHLWSGALDAGSLSEKQRGILKEKKRVTSEVDAKALGNGFLKHVGLAAGAMVGKEVDFFGMSTNDDVMGGKVSGESSGQTGKTAVASTSPKSSLRYSPTASASIAPATVAVSSSSLNTVNIPDDVYKYRKNVIGQTDADIIESYNRHGEKKFIENTRHLAREDPDGNKTTSASTVRRS